MTEMHHEGDSTTKVTFWMGSDWAGEARWYCEGYNVETRSGHKFHSPSFFEAQASVEALYGVENHTPVEHPCPICHQELFTPGFYVEQVDDGCGGYTDMHVACVPPRKRS